MSLSPRHDNDTVTKALQLLDCPSPYMFTDQNLFSPNRIADHSAPDSHNIECRRQPCLRAVSVWNKRSPTFTRLDRRPGPYLCPKRFYVRPKKKPLTWFRPSISPRAGNRPWITPWPTNRERRGDMRAYHFAEITPDPDGHYQMICPPWTLG